MLGVLKFFSSIGAVIMLVVGLIFTGITVYAFIDQNVFITEQSIKQYVLYGLLSVSVIVILVAILAIIGVVRKNCCLIFIYQIFVIIFLATFLYFGVNSSVIPGKVFNGNCTLSSNSFITQANQLYLMSNKYFCHDGCDCRISSASLSKYSSADQDKLNKKYNITQKGVISTQKCPNYDNFTNQISPSVVDTIYQVQKLFQCSDWCQGSSDHLFYRFTDVNNGKPKNFCYTILRDSFFNYSQIVEIASYIVAGLFLLVCVCNICLCCHPNNRKLKFRDRIVYVPRGNYQRLNERGYQKYRRR